MKTLVSAALANRIFPTLLLIALVMGGLLSLSSLTVRTFPEIATGSVRVAVPVPGASPEEVVDSVVIPVEQALSGLPDIDGLDASATQGRGVVIADLRRGADIRAAVADIESEVDRITVFPDEAEDPTVTEVEPDELAVQIVLTGDVTPETLKTRAEAVRADLLALPQVSQVDLLGLPADQIVIEVPATTLRDYDISLPALADRIASESLDLAAGRIETGREQIQLRTLGERTTPEAFRDTPLFASDTGATVRLGDIATVFAGFEDTAAISRLDDRPAVFLEVNRVGDQQILNQVAAVRSYLDDTLRPALPDGIDARVWRNEAQLLDARIDLLSKNAAIGFSLILLILTLFLDLRVALWVALGVAVSFAGSFGLMALFGVSINQLSLFGFILALGIVVDDAIVVGESVYSEQARRADPREAARIATTRMAAPVFFSVSTTIAAFTPLLFLPGASGSFIAPIAAVVIMVLALSLIEAFFILPQHLSTVKPGAPGRLSPRRITDPLRRLVGGSLDRFADGPMRRLIRGSARHPWLPVAASLALLAGSVGLISGGWVKVVFFPQVEGNFVTADVTLPESASEAETLDRARRIASAAPQAAQTVADRFATGADTVIDGTAIAIGFSTASGGPPGAGGAGARNEATVTVKLPDAAGRDFAAADFQQAWQTAVGSVAGVQSLGFSSSLVGVGSAIALQVSAPSEADTIRAVTRLREALSGRDGVMSLSDDRFSAAREIAVEVRPDAQAYGVSTGLVAEQLRAAFFGQTVTTLQRDREEVEVRVRLPQSERDGIADLRDLRIRLGDGFVPVSTVADLGFRPAPAEITRVDGRRVVTLTGDVADGVTTGGAETGWLMRTLVPELRAEIPGLRVAVAGEQEEQGETTPALARNFGLAMVAVYGILALAFGSFTRPVLVLAVLPFGLIGAVAAHYALGLSLTLLSMFGIIGLAGILVNGGLLINDVIQELEAEGTDPMKAIEEATVARFRPILLTTLTTFFGIFPLILETSVQAQFLIPTAVSLAFGLLVGSLLLYVLMPALAAIYAHARRLAGGRAEHRADA